MKQSIYEKIEELERRIQVLEQRPIYYPVPYPVQPQYPTYPVTSPTTNPYPSTPYVTS